MHLKLRRSGLTIGLLFLAAACTEAPTSPDLPARVGEANPFLSAAVSSPGHAEGLTPFPCTFAIQDETGAFRSRQAQVKFPRPELHPDGARRAYLYRGYAGTELVLVARCVIPATDAAVGRVGRAFKLDRGAHGGITTMGCVTTEEGCTLDPVVVDACVGGGTYPNCDSGTGGNDEDYDACYDLGSCGGSGDWDWGGGGGGGGTPSAEPTPYDQGPLLWAACVLAVIGGTYSVDVVADKFVAWYEAHRALVAAQRSLNAVLGMQRDGAVFDEAYIALLAYKVEQAKQRRDDAVGAVKEATGVSVLTLLGAGVACGAAAVAPTP